MALSQEFQGTTGVGARAETALRLPVGIASPLWTLFGAAASAGVAYWWMSRWTRAVNFEALAAFSPTAPLAKAAPAPIEIIAEPEPAVPDSPAALAEAPVVEPAVVAVVEPEVIAIAKPPPAATPKPVEVAADDLTVMTGIGPKLSAALAERGVTRFAQIAAWTGEDLAQVDAALSLKGRAVREAWVAQAKRLASSH